jgi:riboflavin kinase/FMN adenylyltransferase
VKVFTGLEKKIQIPNAHVTIGTFDGVHIGHKKIIDHLNFLAKEKSGESVLFSFDPHPRNVLNPSNPVSLLQTREEKLSKLERLGIQNVILFPFTESFSQTPAENFIREFLVENLKMKSVVIGYDHQFGRNREGSLEHFQWLGKILGFHVEEIPAQDIDDINVSSTKIRSALVNGNIKIANKYLGEPFQLNGIVIHGKSIGKSLGFPTANLETPNKNKILPKTGVYFVRCTFENKTNFGMMNIGQRPTFDSGACKLSTEVHIFDIQNDLYGIPLQVELLDFIREEQKFPNNEALIFQLQKDQAYCRSRFVDYSLRQFTI